MMMILCCTCGIEIIPNERNMCARCKNNTVDLSAKIAKSTIVETCRGCERYHTPPRTWKEFQWGSKDLLLFLLSRNKTLKGLNIIDTSFIYSEQHSKKISVEILLLEDGIEQTCLLEYRITNKQCGDCMRAEAKQYWKACVQLRQKPLHRRTFLFIEQLILNHKAHLKTSNIKERRDGIDFFFLDRTDAIRLVDFISGFYGIRTVNSHQLISEDVRNNTCNKKFTFSVELLPFCKDDLVLVRDRSLGVGRFALVSRVGNSVVFYDPETAKTSQITAKQYFGYENNFKILFRSTQFKEYKVVYARRLYEGGYEATITMDDINLHEVFTHFSIKDGDIVMGYNIADANLATEIGITADVLIARVSGDERRDWALKSDYLLDSEFKYFVEDISGDKHMLSSITAVEPRNVLAEDFSNMRL
ncbi:60S ribosomal export protein NMD3 [Pancytospora epiphaga]|nr:60S ribosomal export protein NMD3 [Pancytospora epiphaga]